jgi:surfeit locus 1 family protein
MTSLPRANIHHSDDDTRKPSSPLASAGLALFGLFWFTAFVGLGNWQVHRLAWKLNLINTVDSRIHAEPVAPPGPATWSSAATAAEVYLHVRAHGMFLNGKETLTQAVADSGPGYWVITPLKTDDGLVILVNRGFVPPERSTPASRAQGQLRGLVVVTGLLRLSEPNGGFLQTNDPAGDQWHSRDVSAIARARGLSGVAPYFIDADATPNPGGFPLGGQTVVEFPNNHLIYAITWYTLALMMAGAAVIVTRSEQAARRQAAALKELSNG